MKKLITMLFTMTIVISLTAQNNGFNFNKTNDYSQKERKTIDTTHLLRVTPQEGDHYDFNFSVSMTGPMSMDMGMGVTYDILSVDNNEINMTIAFTSISMDMSMEGESISYDSKNPGGSAFANLMHEQLGPMFSASLEATMSDRGKTITAADVASIFDGNPDMQKHMEGMNTQMESMFVEYPEEALKIGESFEVTLDKDDTSMDATYTLTDVTETEYILSVNADISGSSDAIMTGSMKGTLHVLRECGMVMSGDITIEMETSGTNMAMELLIETKKS